MEEILHQFIGALSTFIPSFVGFQPSKVVEEISGHFQIATVNSSSSRMDALNLEHVFASLLY